MRVLIRPIAKRKQAGIRPAAAEQITLRGWIAEVGINARADFVRALVAIEEEATKVICHEDMQRPSRLVGLHCRELPVTDQLLDRRGRITCQPTALSKRQLVDPTERKDLRDIVVAH